MKIVSNIAKLLIIEVRFHKDNILILQLQNESEKISSWKRLLQEFSYVFILNWIIIVAWVGQE